MVRKKGYSWLWTKQGICSEKGQCLKPFGKDIRLSFDWWMIRSPSSCSNNFPSASDDHLMHSTVRVLKAKKPRTSLTYRIIAWLGLLIYICMWGRVLWDLVLPLHAACSISFWGGNLQPSPMLSIMLQVPTPKKELNNYKQNDQFKSISQTSLRPSRPQRYLLFLIEHYQLTLRIA